MLYARGKVCVWIAAVALLARPSVALATDYFVSTTGNDGNTCLAAGAACLTIQAAVNKASANDRVLVAAGTYSELVTVNKTLTINGAQAGVNAIGRVGAESILDAAVFNLGRTSFRVTANNVAIDGFTVKNTTDGNVFGFGIWLNPGTSGTRIANNIVEDNIIGLGLGGSNVTVVQNVFRNNNQAGPASGHGIYSDQFVGGVVSNVSITGNDFTNNASAGVGISNTDQNNPFSLFDISQNTFTGNSNAVYLIASTNVQITNNTMTAQTGSTVGLFGDVSNVQITRNTLNGNLRGFRVENFNVNANSAIVISRNNIVGFANEGLLVAVGGHVGPVAATCNWWGSLSGPVPVGTGSSVVGDATFDPWLTGLAPDGPCNQLPRITSNRFTFMGCSAELQQDWVPRYTKLQFDVWNEDEVKFTGAYECADTWHETDFGASVDAAHQNFRVDVLGTYAARYRVQAVGSTQCPGAVPTGVLGVQSSLLLPGTKTIGTTLAGAGKMNGSIKWDPESAVPEGGIK